LRAKIAALKSGRGDFSQHAHFFWKIGVVRPAGKEKSPATVKIAGLSFISTFNQSKRHENRTVFS
jgi:hypothetical protein